MSVSVSDRGYDKFALALRIEIMVYLALFHAKNRIRKLIHVLTHWLSFVLRIATIFTSHANRVIVFKVYREHELCHFRSCEGPV